MRTFDGSDDVCPDNDEPRLLALEALCDPLTITSLRRVRPAQDWHCLEIGAGHGSVACWLAARCPNGSVTATDTDIRHLADLWGPNLRVYRHDVVDGPDLPESSFDLAHTRALLVHLPDRQAVLCRVATWLAPGGWFLVEEPALFPTDPRHTSCLHRALAGFERLMHDQLGSDFRWPWRLPAALHTAGFTDVRSTTIPVSMNTTSVVREFWRINLTELGPTMVESGCVDKRTLAGALAALDAPDNGDDLIMAFVCVSGRRPAEWTARSSTKAQEASDERPNHHNSREHHHRRTEAERVPVTGSE